jgi:hypothetical protein
MSGAIQGLRLGIGRTLFLGKILNIVGLQLSDVPSSCRLDLDGERRNANLQVMQGSFQPSQEVATSLATMRKLLSDGDCELFA